MPEGDDDRSTTSAQADDDLASDAVFIGGRTAGQEDFIFDDLELNIEPYSMELTDQAVLQRRIKDAFAMLMQSAPAMAQMPFLNWPAILDDYFQSINIADGRKYVNWTALEQAIQTQFQPGPAEQVPGLDGAPKVDLDSFRSSPAVNPEAADQEPGEGPQAGRNRTFELSAILGGAA